MNALPTPPEILDSPKAVRQYFADMRARAFDVAWTAYYAHSRDVVFGEWNERFLRFTEGAKERGYPACIQLQATIAPLLDIPESEAQRSRSGAIEYFGKHGIFASFSSSVWQRHLEELITYFVQQCGFDWIVLEEPMYRVDIPGEGDRFVDVFRSMHPDIQLPELTSDTKAYRLVQELKAEELTRFLRQLLLHACRSGATRTGLMPWFFTPSIENTPKDSMNTSCDIGTLSGLDELDFLVVRLQPDNIHANVMRTSDEIQQSPSLYYPEALAHQLGKTVIAVNNPTDEHTNRLPEPMIPLEFFKRSTLASLAAAPGGMTCHWYGKNPDEVGEYMDFLRTVLKFTNRLGNPEAQVAYIVSHSGARHGAPYPYHQIFKRYWAFAKEMLLEKLYPFATLWAGDLKRQLEVNPQVRLLVLSSVFPLTPEQMHVVEEWLSESDGRGLIVFAESPQLSADPLQPGHVQLEKSFPNLHRLLGLPWPDALGDERGRLLLAMDPAAADSFAANVGFAPDVAPIQKLKDQESAAGVSEKKGSTICVLPLGPVDMPDEICRFVRGVAKHCGAEVPVVREAHISVLWSKTKNGFVVLSNLARASSEAQLRTDGNRAYDVIKRRIYSPDPRLIIPPFQFRLLRILKDGDPLLDVDHQLALHSIHYKDGVTTLSALTRGPLSLRSLSKPVSIVLDGSPLQFSSQQKGEFWETRVENEGIADKTFQIAWQ